MPIITGKRLGPYEILSAVGAGGMGEVYRARDTRLDRIVAIKILPDHLADRAELRDRFEREAKTISSLNHPHICTLYDVGHQDGTDFLVMEYLEGETLAARLVKGLLPLDQVLKYAIEIADALDKAHRKGITHRDLKPGNIMLTKSGAKLLDFGLAKLKQEVAPATPISQLPTMKSAITGEGTILGTLQYMAPEQVEAKEVDARTDIFAFGAVVYEMATGRKAFDGKTSASVMAKILEVDPPSMASLQPMTPSALDRVVKTSLAKEPDERWQAAGDLCRELKWIAEGGSQVTSGPKGIRALGRRALILSFGTLLLGAAIGGIAIWNLKPFRSSQPITRTVINLPPGQQLAGLDAGPAVAVSPDGTRIAYVAAQGGTQQLYLRTMDNLEAKPVSGTQGAVAPFFSPDGQWLGFFAEGKLKKVLVSGGAVIPLGDIALGSRGVSWGSRGTIAFASAVAGPLQKMSEAGSTAQPLTRLEKGESSHHWPEFLPGGGAVLFAAGQQVAVQSVETGERRNLVQPGTYPRYAPSGHLVYAQAGTLMAVPFDPKQLRVTASTAIPVEEGVLQSLTTGATQFSLSDTGTLIYVPGSVKATQRRLAWVTRNGTEEILAAPEHGYQGPRLSPDGRKIAVSTDGQVWLYDLLRETLTRFTFEKSASFLAWTPDGKRIAFQSNTGGPINLFWQFADGGGGRDRLTTNEYTQSPNSWSPDGELLAFIEVNPVTGTDIWMLRLSDRKAQPFIKTPFNEGAPRFSPDGRWLAYVSDESGRQEIYVQSYPGPGGKWQISTEGGTEPAWNPHGHELFYRDGDKMMAAEITTQPSFSAGHSHILFEARYVPAANFFPNYDVSPDGQRFLMVKEGEQEQAATQINVVLNWFEELKQKVPTGKK